MPPQTITVIGSLMVDQITVTDRLPDVGESLEATSFSRHLGGKGANAAIAAFRTSHLRPSSSAPPTAPDDSLPAINGVHGLTINGSLTSYTTENDDDIQVRMIGAIGDDEFGPQLLTRLNENGIDTSGVRTVHGQFTDVCVAIVESDFGENRLLMTTGAAKSLPPSDFLTLESLGGGSRKPDLLISQLELLRETVEQILETASREGVDTLLNAAPAKYLLSPLYKSITHLVVNEPEAAMLSGREMSEMSTMAEWASVTDEFLQKGVKNVVVTLGAKGAYYSNAVGNGGYVEAEKGINVVDTTGAGDTFVGTYAVEYIKQKSLGKWDIRHAVARACKASARMIERIGAQEAIPWADEIDPEEEKHDSGSGQHAQHAQRHSISTEHELEV